MKNLVIHFYSVCLILIFSCAKDIRLLPMIEHTKVQYTYLALGDSYTVGEGVLLTENFPNQAVWLLKKDGFDFHAPEILAKTGWTTDELQAAINKYDFSQPYNFVSLLIGVNNQYRGRPVDEYKTAFENLLKQAIHLAEDKADHVIVMSIPDWGVTPFAKGRDNAQIAREIDDYNAANKQIAHQYKVHYLDITPWTREAETDHSLITADGLHPSAKEYKRWAQKISSYIKQLL